MSTVKVSGLTPSYNLNANPAQSLFLTTDLGANNSFSISGAALGSTLYANNQLIVGSLGANIAGNLYATTITTAKGSGQNLIIDPDGLADVIITNQTEVFIQSTFASNSTNNGALVVSGGVGVAGNVYANTVYSNNLQVLTSEPIAQAAFNQANTANLIANTALQNTSTITANSNLIIPGTLTVSGNVVSQNSYIQFNNSSFNPSNAFIQITASNNYSTFAPSNTNYMLQITGKANSTTRVVIDSFGQNTYPVIIGRMGRGSVTAPTAVQINDVMMRITGGGYTGTQFPASSPTKIDFVAAENFSDTNRGTQIQFWNTPVGSNTLTQVASFNALSVSFSGYVNPQKGFVYTPLVYPAAQTAITIDFSNNALVRAQTSTGLVVTLSNLLAGKEVLVWITNTAGTSQTFTHGVSALNSTVNATTYAIPSTSTILARYMSIDGTTQNTFVAVTHA